MVGYFKRYNDASEIEIGDVVMSALDEKGEAFSTCIVINIRTAEKDVALARPHARASEFGSNQAWMSHEVFHVTKERLVDGFVVFCTGSDMKKDNRAG